MTTSAEPDGQEQAPRSASYSNEARDQSHVGVQAHNVIGDVNIYELQGDLPEEKYRVALNFLDGNMPRRAEELIREAVNAGFPANQGGEYTGNHVAYHWELAILSGRSFDHLGNSDFDSIQTAVALGDPDTPDGWTSALQVISDLVNCLIRQEKLGTVDQAEFGMVIDAYQRLDKSRQDEIRRHLDMILVGGIQDQLDAVYAKQVRSRRMGDDRENRVWKFFQPIPQEPRARAIEEPSISGAQRIKAVSGGSLALAGLVIALYLTAGKSYFWTAIAVLLITAGGYAATRFGIARFALMARLADAEKEHGEHASDSHYSIPAPSAEPPAERDKGDEEDTKEARKERTRRREFRRRLREYVDYRFEKEAPRGSKAKDWSRDTARIKDALTSELIGLYDRAPFPDPGAINWLVKWRIKRIAESWRASELRGYRDKLRVPAGTTAAYAAGLAALLAGSGIVLVEMFSEQVVASLAANALAILGGWLLRASMLDVHLVLRHRLPADRAASQRRHEEETAQYQEWRERLGDRPSDAEMARWLDYDRMYVKTLAMNQHGLANRDLVAHAVLTEPGYWRGAARVPNGPWRYSSYIVSVFLLTEAGVRLVAVHLNFRAGVVSNQRRDNFRYDAIAKVHVAELGIRFDGGRRQSILLDEADRHKDDHVESLILSQGFRLALVDGQAKDFVVENVDDGLIDRMREDPERLLELAFDASGVAGALRLLEAVAAEGKEWIAQERARRSRRLLDFQRSLGVLPMLTEAPAPDMYELTSTGNDDLTQTADLGVRVRAIKAFATLHAAELQIAVGDELTVLGHDDPSKRIWVRNGLGQEGWVPADCIAAVPAR